MTKFSGWLGVVAAPLATGLVYVSVPNIIAAFLAIGTASLPLLLFALLMPLLVPSAVGNILF